MNKSDFYKSLRRRNSGVFGTSLSQRQVQGVEATLDECIRQGADLGQAAYILATDYGETGGKMQPRYENMNYSARRIPQVFNASRRQGLSASKLAGNPKLLANTVYGGAWGKRSLGNIKPDDGWRFRGTGKGQITGRQNFTRFGVKMGLPLVDKPDLLMQLDISARALVQPMLEGWATGKKLSDYIQGNRKDYVSARRVWNGTFDAAKYARYAKAFEVALDAAGYAPNAVLPISKTARGSAQANPAASGKSKPKGFLSTLLDIFKDWMRT